MRNLAWLVIGEGEPYLRGSRIDLRVGELILGRRSETFEPDIAFDNFLVSRRHCMLQRELDNIIIVDLGSKHGTAVNGEQLSPHAKRVLADGDMVTLAKGAVNFRFAASTAWDETMELGRLLQTQALVSPLTLDEARRECRVDKELIPVSVKEWDFLWLLHQHAGRLVSYDAIKRTVWNERPLNPGDFAPDVSMDEINTLIYRLRRKLGNHADLIRTVRAQGCMLEKPVELPKTPIDK
ncbi:MAG: transcriptional regulator, winged helix family [Anaerosporomusa subterranea]|jgi:pSer/pThr/pTyr-binding forkhead associated (FHA) protein|nr:transcriptional regulator, winged helix family [Anaerosporomusa subterranea]